MTTEPPLGSPWARHCPDAFPFPWREAMGRMPAGFRRYATNDEEALILGTMTEAEFVGRTGRPTPAPTAKQPARRRPNPVVRKIVLTNRFYDRLATLQPRLSALAVAVWGWLWRCERDGLARTSVERLADRFGVSDRTARRALAELRGRGFLQVVRRGRPGTRGTVYRVRAAPRSPPG